jgi:hypothetical protein
MHDPMTVAFEIHYPWNIFAGRDKYRDPMLVIWHVDPERDGTDDSCGWFIRARHADKQTLKEIEQTFAFEWQHGVPFGWFDEYGNPNYSVSGIVLDMFRRASFRYALIRFSGNTDKAWRWSNRYMQDHVAEILSFAENPVDSLWGGITRYWQIKHSEPERRSERIHEFAACIYTYILRSIRPWWKHPRWHFWHWSIQVPAWQRFRRWVGGYRNEAACGIPAPVDGKEQG